MRLPDVNSHPETSRSGCRRRSLNSSGVLHRNVDTNPSYEQTTENNGTTYVKNRCKGEYLYRCSVWKKGYSTITGIFSSEEKLRCANSKILLNQHHPDTSSSWKRTYINESAD
jgi:hypothetical protein